MRALVVLNTPGFLRYYDTTIDLLLERGHQVLLSFTDEQIRADALDNLSERPRDVTRVPQVPRRTDRYAPVADEIRALLDFSRFLHPAFARTDFLRDRRRLAVLDLPIWGATVGRLTTAPAFLATAWQNLLLDAERALPSDPVIAEYLRELRPDVVVVSPLVTPASPQTDVVKSARALGIPTGVAIASWDNLTNKGLIREQPDRVFVWNAAQGREAVELHAVQAERVVITGAQPFDRWFGAVPELDRETFCQRVGLDPGRPFVVFAGSTSNITDPRAEDRFLSSWARHVRTSDDALVAHAGLLLRPHPDRRGPWADIDIDGLDDVVVWPKDRPNSVTRAGREEYFASLYHAAALVGINTSAMVEAALIDRPVLTLRLPQFREAHEGTLHFSHLQPENGGPLAVAADLDEHVAQLSALLRDPAAAHERNGRFVAGFVRPHGVDRPAVPILVGAIEALAETNPAPSPQRAKVLGWLLDLDAALHERRAVRRADLRRKLDFKPMRQRAKRLNGRLEKLARKAEPAAPVVAHGLRGAQRQVRKALERWQVRMRRRRQRRRQHIANQAATRRARAAQLRRRWGP